MECARCGGRTRYNRAVVDVVTDTIIGGLCVTCEREQFGSCLLDGRWEEVGGCVLCRRSGRYALAQHKMDIRQKSGREHIEEGFGVEAESPRLCEEHVTLLVDYLTARVALADGRGPHRGRTNGGE